MVICASWKPKDILIISYFIAYCFFQFLPTSHSFSHYRLYQPSPFVIKSWSWEAAYSSSCIFRCSRPYSPFDVGKWLGAHLARPANCFGDGVPKIASLLPISLPRILTNLPSFIRSLVPATLTRCCRFSSLSLSLKHEKALKSCSLTPMLLHGACMEIWLTQEHSSLHLQELPDFQRADAVSSLVYEANARKRDPVYGSVGIICYLQNQISQLQMQLAFAEAELLCIQMRQERSLANQHVIDIHEPSSLFCATASPAFLNPWTWTPPTLMLFRSLSN